MEGQAVGVVPQPIERGGGEQTVGRECLIPFREVEVGGDDGRRLLVALGDQIVEILVGRRTTGHSHGDNAAIPCNVAGFAKRLAASPAPTCPANS